jgi:hypothetical protein
MLLVLTIFLIKKEALSFEVSVEINKGKKLSGKVAMYVGLFLICLACVIRLLDYRITLLIVLTVILIFDRKVLKRVDYTLL